MGAGPVKAEVRAREVAIRDREECMVAVELKSGT